MFLFLRAGKKVKEEISPTLLPEGQSSNFRTGKHQWVADFLENYPPFQAPFVSPLGGICYLSSIFFYSTIFPIFWRRP
jgi:hypothetical protein